MKIISFLFLLSLIIALTASVVAIHLTGRCGYPGKPYRAKLEPDNKLHYLEGEEVTYQCLNYWTYVQTRRCERGKWVGNIARCGEFVNDTTLDYVRVDDISDPTRPPVTKFEHINMTLVQTAKFANIFLSKRFPKARLRIFNDRKHRWTLRFTKPNVKLFMKMNFNFINYTYLSEDEQKSLRFNVSVRVSPYRTCRLDYQTEGEKWWDEGLKIDSYFACDSKSLADYAIDVENPPNEMIIEAQASLNITYDFIALYFGKAFGTPNEPICGDPEVPFGLTSRIVTPDMDYSVVCANDRDWKYVSKFNPDLPGTPIHKQRCAGDMRWNGSYPECVPRKPCPVNGLLLRSDANQTLINSITDVFYMNAQPWNAVEGSMATYGCADSSNDILFGRETRTCQKNGTWSGEEPHCYNPSARTKFPVIVVISSLGSALLVVIAITAVVFYYYTKRIKRGIRKQITQQAGKSEYEKYDAYGPDGYNDYDDIGLSGLGTGKDKDIYDAYEMVGEPGEVRYAEAYCPRGTVQKPMPGGVDPQSSDDYWRIPPETTYLDMSVTAKPLPSPRRSLSKKEKVDEYVL